MRKRFAIYATTIAALLLGNGGGLWAQSELVSPADSVATEPDGDAPTAATVEETVPEGCIIDEVIWIVGDEPILKSDVEMMRMQAEMEGIQWEGDPDCAIPEQLAVQKLFLHQAEIDSIEVSDSDIASALDTQIDRWVQAVGGSREKLEEYRNQTISQIREQLYDEFKNGQRIQQMKQKLIEDIQVTPADVRAYFKDVPEDSIPFVPTEVEIEIITREPKITQEEIAKVKEELREYTERVTSGETSFSVLARMYSEDPGSARQGGEMDYVGRGYLDPAFANVAFNLTDPKKVSKIVESEYGFHIIQLIDRRGDRIKVRHILRKPKVRQEDIDEMIERLDTVATDIREGRLPFETAVAYVSDDKDTRYSKGLMSNITENGRTSKFQMKDLPTEVARVVETMEVGDVSKPFQMIDRRGKTVCAIIRLRSRTPAHKATMTDDFQVLKDVVLSEKREKFLHDWVVDKIKVTYVRMNDRYKDCDFEYQGWIK